MAFSQSLTVGTLILNAEIFENRRDWINPGIAGREALP
jgi:hypothetical protein